jgi:6-methylsalicylate decarboxylase
MIARRGPHSCVLGKMSLRANMKNVNEVRNADCTAPTHSERLHRRLFLSQLGGLAALSTAAVILKGDLWAGAPPSTPELIDIHTHYAPPDWVSEVASKQGRGMLGNTSFLNTFKSWTPARSIEQMDQAGIATSFVSITTPGIWFGEDVSTVEGTRRLARQCNEYGTKMASDFPGRFGLFASLPLPDVDGSLREIDYAIDTLHADGFGLLSHYSETYGEKLLGDPAFAPVFEELNRRKAIVYVHRKIAAEPYEIFGWDVHRTILSLLKSSGTGARTEGLFAPRFPEIRFIFCDAGGTMPFLVQRSTAPSSAAGPSSAAETAPAAAENTLLGAIRKFYYGTGRSNNTGTISALKQVVPVSHILFGTDYPFARVADEARGLQNCGVFDAAELQGVSRDNTIALIPRLRR